MESNTAAIIGIIFIIYGIFGIVVADDVAQKANTKVKPRYYLYGFFFGILGIILCVLADIRDKE